MKVAFHHTFTKRFRKMPRNARSAFEVRLTVFFADPFHPILRNHAVGRAYPGCRSINITGDIRAIYRLSGETATFLLIGTHAELY